MVQLCAVFTLLYTINPSVYSFSKPFALIKVTANYKSPINGFYACKLQVVILGVLLSQAGTIESPDTKCTANHRIIWIINTHRQQYTHFVLF